MSIRSKPVHLIRFFCSSCQDLPLGHCGIISLVGHLRGERAVVRRSLLLKGGFNKELLLLQPPPVAGPGWLLSRRLSLGFPVLLTRPSHCADGTGWHRVTCLHLLSIPAHLSSPLCPSPQAGPLIPKATSELISCFKNHKLQHPPIR